MDNSNLEMMIRVYDDVYLLGEGMDLSVLACALGTLDIKILFLIPEKYYLESDATELKAYRLLTDSDYDYILNLYNTYEFSDNFHFLSCDDKNYGGIMNLVKTGILSKEDAYKATFGLRI